MGALTNGQVVVAVLCASVILQAYARVASHRNGVHHMSNNKQRVFSMNSFSWNDCGEASYPGHLKSLTLTPDPLDLPGNVSVGFSGILNVSLASPIVLDLQIQKKAAAWFTLPCIAQLGSCNYQDICPFLEKIDCPPFFEKYGIPCKCPIAAGAYNLPPTSFFVDDRIPSIVSNGHYKVTANLSQNDEKVACVQLEFSITRS